MDNMPDGAFETPLQVFPRATGAPERLQGHRSCSIRVVYPRWGCVQSRRIPLAILSR